MAEYNGMSASFGGTPISGTKAPWVDNPDTKLQDMINDVLRAATTRIGAPSPAQAALMGKALDTQLGVSGKGPMLATEQAKVAGDQYKTNTDIVQGQKPNVTGIGVGGREPEQWHTPMGTPTANKMPRSKVTDNSISDTIKSLGSKYGFIEGGQ